MVDIKLADYDLGELKGLLFEIEQEIKERRKRELQVARSKIATIAEDAGLPLDRLLK
jgi:DNA-binding protein H-NS